MTPSENENELGKDDAVEQTDNGGEDIAQDEFSSPGIGDRMQRIHDHRVGAYYDPRTTKSLLGFVCADLLVVEAHLGEALRQELTAGPASIEVIEKNRSPIDLMLRLSKQVAQITQVDMQYTKMNEIERPRLE